ncbi:MAG: ArsA-related P-loop ATPase [Kineosporiaceae bacterium]
MAAPGSDSFVHEAPDLQVMADRVRLHVVTGKGGVGKTTVAAALATALATGGRRVLVCEVEGRQGLAPLFGTAPLGYEERLIARTDGGGEVFGLSVEPKAALLEYLEIFYHLGRAGRVLERMGAVDFATTVAPGLRDVLLTGKVYEAVRRREAGGHVYDAVVLDAPPTGRVVRFLNVNEEVVGLAKVGPVRNQAGSIMAVLRNPATAVHLVTLLEEMPVQETLDGVQELRAARLPVGAVVVNGVRDPLIAQRSLTAASRGRLDREQVLAGLAAALPGRGPADLDAIADGLLETAREHGVRVALQARLRESLEAAARPIAQLPALDGGVDLGALHPLAQRLREQGLR